MHEPPGSNHPENLFVDTFAAFLKTHAGSGAAPPWTGDQTDFWFRVSHQGASLPEQGWKIHVSANLHAAGTILLRVLEALREIPVCFKFTRSPNQLLSLNRGDGSATQIGKFITVYPQSDEQAVQIAVALDRATEGLSGPGIASDRKLRPGSLVHYRYGSFGGKFLQTSIGAVTPGIRAPDGTLVPDKRGTSFQHPAWTVDPFAQAGVVVEGPPKNGLVSQRFFPIAPIYSSPFSTVSLAVDIKEGRRCVLKSVRHDLTFGDTDLAASALLRREAETLQALAPDPAIPVLYEVVDDGERLYLAMEDIDGVTLEQAVAMRRDTHQRMPSSLVADWGKQLAGLLGTLHNKGYGYLDLKPTNLIVTPKGVLRLIDFDAATPLGAARKMARGTRGYLSPQRAAGHQSPVNITDDIYALGAMLYLLATGSEPSLAPDPVHLLGRPLSVMAPTLHPELAAVIERCLSPDPAARFADMSSVAAAIERIDGSIEVPHQSFGMSPSTPDAPDAQARYLAHARRLGETLLAVAKPMAKGDGLAWSSSHPTGAGLQSRDLNSGSAGALLGLCAVAAESRDQRLLEGVQRGALWLGQAPAPEGAPLAGLYVGEGGIILSLLRAGQVLGSARWVEAAAARSRALGELPYGSPDLFNGTAGRLRVHLWLWEETGAQEELAAARRCGEALLAAATVGPAGERSWTIPPGYDDMSGDAYLGYAHGAAGIADALLDLFKATGDERYAAAVVGAAAWLRRLAVAPEGLEAAAVWPSKEGEPPATSFWCHGATGIGMFLLRAGTTGVDPSSLEWAERAAWPVARLTRWVGATRCHGLAGNIEFLLDCYQATRREAFLTEASTLGSLLLSQASERDGLLVFASESPTVFSPDYMVGYAGVAACLLRLAHPQERLVFRQGATGFVHHGDVQSSLASLP